MCARSLNVGEFLNDSLVDFSLKRLQAELAAQLSAADYEARSGCRCAAAGACVLADAVRAFGCSAASIS
jgi:hypothetical protein